MEPDDLVGQELASFVAPDDLLGLTDVLAAAEPGLEPATRTLRLRSGSGAFRYMSVSARPVEDPTAGQHAVVSMRDVTEELRAKRELARSEEQFRMALMGAPEGMAVTDSQDRIVQANPALCELLGTSLAALIGHRFREFIPDEDREQVDLWRERLLRGGVSIERSQHRLVSPTSEVWVDHSIGIMRDELGNPQLFVHQFADRTAARRLQADLAYRASHDVQTGLANRESLHTRLGQRLGCPPESAEYVGVLFCDIDNLKPINDRHGHLVGDAVISTVANRLERAVRRQDVVARVGGDEFVILLDHCSSLPELRVVASNVHSAASHPVETSAGSVPVTISVGAVLAESTAETDDALARADAALYRAKRSGGDRISVEGMTDD
jgi:diguanylate cyclase (GGDEF)-like protein/PAS domain S-box-containing protein